MKDLSNTDALESNIKQEIVSSKTDPLGFIIREEIWTMEGCDPTNMTLAYTQNGDYVGDPDTATRLYRRGILPIKRRPESVVCSMGFSEKDQKWYGWSHRALAGFGIGSRVKKGDVLEESTCCPVGFTAATLDDARQMAECFAELVS